MGEAEVANLLFALGAILEVLLDLALFVRPERAHHVRPEKVSQLRVVAHRRITRPRPRPWPGAEHAARPSYGS